MSGSAAGGDSSDSSGDERDLNRLLNALSFERLLGFAPATSAPAAAAAAAATATSGPSTSQPAALALSAHPFAFLHDAARRKHAPLFPFFGWYIIDWATETELFLDCSPEFGAC